jgi:hypothetical protein
LVLDCFAGSGTTAAVAQRQGRRWIACDAGRHALHTTRKRLIGIQREMAGASIPGVPFDVYEIAQTERRWWAAGGADRAAIILAPLGSFDKLEDAGALFERKDDGALFFVATGEKALGLDEVAASAVVATTHGRDELFCMAWEFERGWEDVAPCGIRLRRILIPREILTPGAGAPKFFEPATIRAEPVIARKGIDVRIVEFTPSREVGTVHDKADDDLLDYWAVDFLHEPGKTLFTPQWEAFRDRRHRKVVWNSDRSFAYDTPGLKHILIKGVDVFGLECETAVPLAL